MPRGDGDRLRPYMGRGRPKGALNKRTVEIQTFSLDLLRDPGYLAALKIRLRQGKAQHIEVLLHHYAFGKPRESIEHSGEIATAVRIVHEYRDQPPAFDESPSVKTSETVQ